MKNLLSFLILLLILPLILIVQVSAIETSIKQEYKPGETLISEISGNFLENLKPENILFYSGRAYTPLIYDISKIQDNYYLYALLPVKERNYTLIIKNAKYFEQGQEFQEDLSFNFSAKGSISDFTANPGFIITNKDFKVKVTSNVKTISIEADFLNSTQEISLLAGQTKTLSFSTAGINNFTFTNLTLTAEDTTYKIPVAIFASTNISLNEKNLRFSKSFLNLTVLKDSSFEFEISILNTGQEDINNINLSTALPITLNPNTIDKLEAGEIKNINLTINSGETGFKEGNILAASDNYTDEISIYLATTENMTELEDIVKNTSDISGESCSQLSGKICNLTQDCTVSTRFTIDGLCCTGECKENKSTGNTIYIIIIIAVLAVIGFFVYKKLKVRKKTSGEILKEKEKVYEERFKARETEGSLTKV